MIPDEDDDDGIIDFSYIAFIGRKKLGLTFKETFRLTYTMFDRLYKHYKDDWDTEMKLFQNRVTYAKAYEAYQKSLEWF